MKLDEVTSIGSPFWVIIIRFSFASCTAIFRVNSIFGCQSERSFHIPRGISEGQHDFSTPLFSIISIIFVRICTSAAAVDEDEEDEELDDADWLPVDEFFFRTYEPSPYEDYRV